MATYQVQLVFSSDDPLEPESLDALVYRLCAQVVDHEDPVTLLAFTSWTELAIPLVDPDSE